MDPTAMMGEYNHAEIWPLLINGVDSTTLCQSKQDNVRCEENDPMITDLTGGSRKRPDSGDVANVAPMSNSDCDGKRVKRQGSGEEILDSEIEPEANSSKSRKKNAKIEPPKQDYIHVRARRGQATDSHSLAERARREKISERMKVLQDLVPGCNKVIGKASVLDEIINYIQSLQHQVEFLSMKLEAVNSKMDPGMEGFPSKDFVQQAYDTPGVAFGSQAMRDYGKDSSPEWLHMQLGGSYERTT